VTKELDVVIDDTGRMRFVFDDDLAALIPAGYVCPIRRASHVEPTADGKWTADMRPAFLDLMTEAQRGALGGSEGDEWWKALTLGPFATRAEALAAEVAWLKRYAGV
jgi:hypothetical protein